jgi:hypothetical protein
VGQVLVVEIEVVGGSLSGFQDGQVLFVEMRVSLVSLVKCEKEGIVRVVGIEDVHSAEIELIVARHHC